MKNVERALELGRRLREGSLSKEERAAMKTYSLPEGSLEDMAIAGLDAIDLEELDLRAAVLARDAAETILVVLGAVEDTEAERRLAARLAAFDAAMLARRDAWGATAIDTNDPWLRRIASLDASPWWLDVVALGPLREAVKAFEPAFAFRDVRPAPMKLRTRASAASMHAYAEVVGMEDDPARVAIERGAVIARMFDGEIEVFALGLRADQIDLPAGLCVARRGGGVTDITFVALGGAEGGKSQSGWWTPMPESGTASLVVRLGDREESLPLDIVS